MALATSDPRLADTQQTYPPRAAVISWIFCAWAAEPFFTLITTFVFAPYFATHVASDPASGQALWGFATAAAGMTIALLSPVLGATAEPRARRKAVERGLRRHAGDRLRADVVRQAWRCERDPTAAARLRDRN